MPNNNFNWPVPGNEKIINYLNQIIKNNNLGHGYLFYGPPGLGKSKIAHYFISSIFCLSEQNKPCGTCSHCQQIQKNIHPDIIIIKPNEDKKNITIEQIRQMRSQVQTGSFMNSYRAVIVRSANSLSTSASNAMLKILEQPLAKTVFVFIADSLTNIPATVISRLQLIKFNPIPVKIIRQDLINQGIESEQAFELASLSAGFPGRISKFISTPSNLDNYKQKISDILDAISGNINSRFLIIEKIASQNKSHQSRLDADDFLDNLLSIIRDFLMIKSMSAAHISNKWAQIRLSSIQSAFSTKKLINISEKINTTKKHIKQNVNLRLALENLMLKF